jgi:hypothetical protein
MKNPHHQDKTEYARLIGYRGKKPVIVCDGKVISHRSQCWYAFCRKAIRQQQRRNSTAQSRSEYINAA